MQVDENSQQFSITDITSSGRTAIPDEHHTEPLANSLTNDDLTEGHGRRLAECGSTSPASANSAPGQVRGCQDDLGRGEASQLN
jgi:hypothetical protein